MFYAFLSTRHQVIVAKSIALVLTAVMPCIGANAQDKVNKFANEIGPCKVVRVIDGDTAVFRCPGWRSARHVRIMGYNAPDKCQPLFLDAKQWLADTLAQGVIHLDTRGRDQYERTLAHVLVNGARIKPPKSLRAPRQKCPD